MLVEAMSERSYLIIGDGSVARRTLGALATRSLHTVHLAAPSDNELRDVLGSNPADVAILVHDDATPFVMRWPPRI
jgi:hypothetical protein